MKVSEITVSVLNEENKAVKETILIKNIDSLTILDSMLNEMYNSFELISLRFRNVSEFLNEKPTESEKYFNCKFKMITMDERSAKEKEQTVEVIVNAENIEMANKTVKASLEGMAYRITQLSETKIVKVV